MRKSLTTLSLFAFAGIAIAASVSAHAQLVNGSFESGFASWVTTGVTSIQTSAFGVTPPDGLNQALATNGPGSSDQGTIDAFFGLPSSAVLNAFGLPGTPNATNGSGFKQTFTAVAGSPVSFRWNFLTSEVTPEPNGFNDFAFVVVDGTAIKLADTFFPVFSTGPGSTKQTGYQLGVALLGLGSTHTVGFGVMNVGDMSGPSGLLVDNVTVAVAAIPEPSTYALMLAGLGIVGFVTRRRKTRAPA